MEKAIKNKLRLLQDLEHKDRPQEGMPEQPYFVTPVYQQGFKANGSCHTNIIRLGCKLYEKRENEGKPTWALFIDFRKAFDSVSRSKLIKFLSDLSTEHQAVADMS